MTEPVFIATKHEHDSDKRWEWMSKASQAAASSHNCAFFRVSFDQATLTCLLEGWLEKPEDCGEPRWPGRG